MMIPQKLLVQGYTLYNGEIPNGKGFLNDTTLLTHPSNDLFVLRCPVKSHRDEIEAYLYSLYSCMIEHKYIFYFSYRSVREQVLFIARCEEKGLPVQEVVDYNSQWMLLKYIPGITLKDYLYSIDNLKIIEIFLDQILYSHINGIALMDRWGGNEIVTGDTNISFIDFDIKLTFCYENCNQCENTFDLATALLACIKWSRNKEKALVHILEWLNHIPRCHVHLYDFLLLAQFIEGSCRFYEASKRRAGLPFSTSIKERRYNNFMAHQLVCGIK